jgi:hypothetical protein
MNLSYNNAFKQTRDFIQDVAKVMGKAQQAFLPTDPNDWHRGLIVTQNGINSQQLEDHTLIELNLRNGEFTFETLTLPLKDLSAQDIVTEITKFIGKEVEQPELFTTSPKYDHSVALHILEILNRAHESLNDLRKQITTGVTSPVLLYPHHFDISLAWFPERLDATQMEQKHQLTFGLSTGDSTIAEPYFYITSYPDSNELEHKPFIAPAYWNKKDFEGAILHYSQASEPGRVLKFFTLALN